jgi:hypothetical protein
MRDRYISIPPSETHIPLPTLRLLSILVAFDFAYREHLSDPTPSPNSTQDHVSSQEGDGPEAQVKRETLWLNRTAHQKFSTQEQPVQVDFHGHETLLTINDA